jgi:hypothetical protein
MKQELSVTDVTSKRNNLINKMSPAYYEGGGDYADAGILSAVTKLCENKSLATETIKSYSQIINCVYNQYKTDPEFAKSLNGNLPDQFDHAVALRLHKLNDFFQAFEADNEMIECLEFHRLIDKNNHYTVEQLNAVEEQYDVF